MKTSASIKGTHYDRDTAMLIYQLTDERTGVRTRQAYVPALPSFAERVQQANHDLPEERAMLGLLYHNYFTNSGEDLVGKKVSMYVHTTFHLGDADKPPHEDPTGDGFERLKDHMLACGWAQESDGRITHHTTAQSFTKWEDAMKTCLEVASEA